MQISFNRTAVEDADAARTALALLTMTCTDAQIGQATETLIWLAEHTVPADGTSQQTARYRRALDELRLITQVVQEGA